jgi:hypothetical protein
LNTKKKKKGGGGGGGGGGWKGGCTYLVPIEHMR